MNLSPGQTLGHYRILEKAGAGGMGVVYRAEDTRLRRQVALKVLPAAVTASADRLGRFEAEARAVAALSHPNVVTIHAVEEVGGVHSLAMEWVEGRTLDRHAREAAQTGTGLPLDLFRRIALPLVSAVAAAHARGVIHRDIKPGNIMLAGDGTVKVLDFGLAKQLTAPDAEAAPTSAPTAPAVTGPQPAAGAVLGTVGYMSPEQAAGRPAGAPSDGVSLGVVLYELLTGRRAFQEESDISTLAAILHKDPPPPRESRADLPADLDALVQACLEKDPARRPASAVELEARLKAALPGLEGGGGGLRRAGLLTVAAVVLLAVAGAGGLIWFLRAGAEGRRVRLEILPRVQQLIEERDHVAAFLLAREAQEALPDDPLVQKLLRDCTTSATLTSEPPGARVQVQAYAAPEAEWLDLGPTPIQGIRVPEGHLRIRLTLPEHEPWVAGRNFRFGPIHVQLTSEGGERAGMVRVEAGDVHSGGVRIDLDPFWIDRLEVTNREYQRFVDAGGYRSRDHWRFPVRKDGRELAWEEAMDLFRDTTGRPGPAGWELGRFPEGKGDLPVTGVCWYEAAAYAAFAGKELPTVHHWRHAAGLEGFFADILQFSHFGGSGPRPAAMGDGVSLHGTLNMAGNVSEWCFNQTGHERYLVGGSWLDPPYVFHDPLARDPLTRESDGGFRCAVYDAPVAAQVTAPVDGLIHDFTGVEPAGDQLFQAFLSLYRFDPSPLNARVESRDDSSPYWRHEVASLDAAYPGERVQVHLFLPRDAPPPWQTVVFAPGSESLRLTSSAEIATSGMSFVDFLPRAGRALVHPIFKETFDRNTPADPRSGPQSVRDLVVAWSKDLQRTLDYLETREDIDSSRLAFSGLSFGAEFGPIYLVVEPRFRTAVLLGGGFDDDHMLEEPPEIQPWHFAPRVRIPVLMLNGLNDFLFPLETAQKPFFDLLGTPAADKRHVVSPGGHAPDKKVVIRETLDWLDRYLGPVTPGAPPAHQSASGS